FPIEQRGGSCERLARTWFLGFVIPARHDGLENGRFRPGAPGVTLHNFGVTPNVPFELRIDEGNLGTQLRETRIIGRRFDHRVETDIARVLDVERPRSYKIQAAPSFGRAVSPVLRRRSGVEQLVSVRDNEQGFSINADVTRILEGGPYRVHKVFFLSCGARRTDDRF